MSNKIITIILKVTGYTIMILAIVHALIYQFPSAGLGTPLEVLIAFGVGLCLLLVSPESLKKKLDKKLDKLAEK